MAFLDTNIVEQLKGYFDKISEPVEIVSFLDDSQKSLELKAFLTEIDEISDKVNYTEKSFGEDTSLEEKARITRPVSFTLLKNNEKTGINFYGIPGGHEFNSFILAVLGLAGLGKKLEEEQINRVLSVNKPLNIETGVYLEEVAEKNIQGVPVVYINGKQAAVGEQTVEQLINLVVNA